MGEVRIERSVMYMSTAATPQDSNDFTQPNLEFYRREQGDLLDQRLGKYTSERSDFFDSRCDLGVRGSASTRWDMEFCTAPQEQLLIHHDFFLGRRFQ